MPSLTLNSVYSNIVEDTKITSQVITEQFFQKKESKFEKRSVMEKEIFEQPDSIRRTMEGRVNFEKKQVFLQELIPYINDILRCKRLIVFGAASSHHVAIGTRQIMEELVELPVFIELASDFLDREVPIFRNDICIFISQSGETSSILEACLYCKNRDALTMSITNSACSSLQKITDLSIDIKAGTELGITSTKSYTSQFVTLVLFALQLASDKRTKQSRVQQIIDELHKLPDKIETVLSSNDKLREISKQMVSKTSVLVMGRGYQQSSCLEGSFKLKEVSNVHSEGIHSGELKHGPLALIDDQIPIIMIIMRDTVFDKCMNALQQVKARNGHPILICENDDLEVSKMAEQLIQVPKTIDCLAAVLTVIPMQLISLHLALYLNKNVDNPDGLVKTVIENN